MFELQTDKIFVHRPTQAVLLSDASHPVSGAAWWQQMLRCKAWCEQNEGQRFALFSADLYVLSVWLVALAASDKSAVVAPNDQAATQTELGRLCDGALPRDLPVDGDYDGASVTFRSDQPLYLFTSGTQGSPTLVTRYWWQLLREAETLGRHFAPWRESGVDVVGTVSHQHIYGLLFRFFLPFQCGLSTQRRVQAFSEQWLQCLQQRSVILVSSPAHLRRFADFDALAERKSRLRAVFSSGGALPAVTARHWQAEGGPAIDEIYGSTETGGVAWRRQHAGYARWRALPGVELQLGAQGRLCIRSRHLQPTTWVCTDDRVEHLEGDTFELAGRIDRIVKVEEKRLSLDAMETACCAHTWVTECAALVLQPHTNGRQIVALAVVLNDLGREQLALGKRKLSQALREHLQQHFEPVLLPKRIRYLDQLPYTAQGKLPRDQLHELFAL